jgi:hypothetical protein
MKKMKLLLWTLGVSTCVLIAAWLIRFNQLPSWQKPIDTELLIGRWCHVVSNECVQAIFAEYRKLPANDCTEKLSFFKYLTFNYLIPVEGDAHGRESVAEMIAGDNCKDAYLTAMKSIAETNGQTMAPRELSALRAWIAIVTKAEGE